MFIVNLDTYRTMQNFNNGVCVSMVMYWTVIALWPNFQNIWNSRGLSIGTRHTNFKMSAMITAQRFSATITTVVTPHTGHILITISKTYGIPGDFPRLCPRVIRRYVSCGSSPNSVALSCNFLLRRPQLVPDTPTSKCQR
jgi:hypothetical protein